MRSWLDQRREKINIRLNASKDLVLKGLRVASLLVSLSAVGILVYYFGFPIEVKEEKFLFSLVEISFTFYVLKYLLLFIYDYHPKEFFRQNWLEGIIVAILILEGISSQLFDTLLIKYMAEQMGMPVLTSFSLVFVQLYLLLVVVIDFTRRSGIDSKKIKLHPSLIFIFTFFIIIVVGMGLLKLPEMTAPDVTISWLDALFTSASATCVTGLILHDTATFFTFKGQLVIMFLIKLGGLNIIAFGTFMALFSRLGFGVKHHQVIEDFVNKDSLLSYKGMLGRIFLISFALELFGAIFFFMYWDGRLTFPNTGMRMFHSFFHSISSFNNAGFSTFTNGFYHAHIKYSFILHVVSAVLIFLGSLGFTTLLEIFDFQKMRERIRLPWKQLSTGAKISLYTSVGLTIGGGILIYLLEYDKLFAGDGNFASIVSAMFSSVTTRTAGFNTVDFAQFSAPTLLIIIVLMFIGASSSSTGGGIKTSTFFLIVSSTYATITGRPTIEFNRKTIPNDLVNKAYSVLIYSLILVMFSTFLLCITESENLNSGMFTIMDLLFEEISAFSTVGLSLGVTPTLSMEGKWIIIVSMFIGRIGTLTVAYVLTKNLSNLKYKYPDAHLMVG